MRLAAARQSDSMAAWYLSLEIGVMTAHMDGRLVSSCAWKRWRSTEIWYPHCLVGVLFCGAECMGAGAVGVSAWRIICSGSCLGRGGGDGGTIAWHTSLWLCRVGYLTSMGVTERCLGFVQLFVCKASPGMGPLAPLLLLLRLFRRGTPRRLVERGKVNLGGER